MQLINTHTRARALLFNTLLKLFSKIWSTFKESGSNAVHKEIKSGETMMVQNEKARAVNEVKKENE